MEIDERIKNKALDYIFARKKKNKLEQFLVLKVAFKKILHRKVVQKIFINYIKKTSEILFNYILVDDADMVLTTYIGE